MRLRAVSEPEFPYAYLVNAVGARAAESVIRAAEGTREGKRYERALRSHLTSMYDTWDRTLWRRPTWDGNRLGGLRFDDTIDQRTRYMLFTDAAFATPLDSDERWLSDTERLAGLGGLAAWLRVDDVWSVRALEIRDSAFAAHREPTPLFSRGTVTNLLRSAAGVRDRASGPQMFAGARGTDNGTDVHGALAEASRRVGAARRVDLRPAFTVAEVVRLQMHAALVDGWALLDVAAVGERIDALAERRAELQLAETHAELLSETERADATASALTVERALDWLYAQHTRAGERASSR